VVLLPPLLKLGQQVFLFGNPIVKGNHPSGLRSIISCQGTRRWHIPIIAQPQVRAELWSAQREPAMAPWRQPPRASGQKPRQFEPVVKCRLD
jgi:hypothetical protein